MHSLRIPPNDAAGDIVKSRFTSFLQNYVAENLPGETLTVQQRLTCDYMYQIEKMIETDNSTTFVNFLHLQDFDCELAEAIEMEYYRFDGFLRVAVRDVVLGMGHDTFIINSEKEQRELFVAFYNLPRIDRIRSLKTDRIGHLLSVVGTVTRTSEVRPELLFASYTCTKCGTLHASVEQQFQFTEPQICRHPNCDCTRFQILVEQCVFVDWQRLRVQENADEIPAGSMPRCMDIICRNSTVENAKAGDKVIFTGMVAVVPDTSGLSRAGEATVGGKGGDGGADTGVQGLKKLGVKEMTYKMLFLACSIQHIDARMNSSSGISNIVANCYFSKNLNKSGKGTDEAGSSYDYTNREDSAENILLDLTEAQKAEIASMRNSPHLYSKMVDSICPTVFGHAEVKRGVLLMLFGGVHKETLEHTSLRGDLNVCIVGDPSCAKSQFLKYVHGFLPRCIYTSGKSSSAAGLTASVTKDSETGEFCVEAGALMLADNGICCIDEFDKMDQVDQVAIHEAMEQQTISITKAGVVATLNARTSILAAANPIFGRYDRTKTLKANVNISAPIMSRFDLFFIILDECNPTLDEAIARHIVGVHQDNERKKLLSTNVPFTQQQLQRYIRFAKCINPQLNEESRVVLVECYRLLRQGDMLGKNKTAYRITVRQLESLIRLSEALARLHLDEVIQPAYVREAYRLLQKSIIFVESEDIELDDNEEEMDKLTQSNLWSTRQHGTQLPRDVVEEDPASRDFHAESACDTNVTEATGEGGDSPNTLKRRRESLLSSPEHVQMEIQRSDANPTNGDGSESAELDKSGAVSGGGATEPIKKKSKSKISADDYRAITNMVMLFLKRQEDEWESSADGSEFNGCQCKSIIEWYLNECESELVSVEIFEQKKKLIKNIIKRMIKVDHMLLEMEQYGENVSMEDKMIRRHPSVMDSN